MSDRRGLPAKRFQAEAAEKGTGFERHLSIGCVLDVNLLQERQ